MQAADRKQLEDAVTALKAAMSTAATELRRIEMLLKGSATDPAKALLSVPEAAKHLGLNIRGFKDAYGHLIVNNQVKLKDVDHAKGK